MVELCRKLVASQRFTWFIIAVIVAAGILAGIQTFPDLESGHAGLWTALDRLILTIFIIEIAIKMIALSPHPLRYFRDGWNLFDFTIVAVCLLPFGGAYATVLRLFRLLRVLRLISVVPRLQILVGAILRSLPSMFYVTLLLTLLFYIYGVLGVILFRANDPVHFGDLWTSLLSLFRVVTLEDWTDIMYLQMHGSDAYDGYNQSTHGLEIRPEAQPLVGALYFVSFVMLGTMVMLNLVIGVIINGMDSAQKEVADRQMHELLKGDEGDHVAELDRQQRLAELRQNLRSLADELDHLTRS